ncbi:MAG TPA: phosphotransferase [Hanamia sp.]
MSDFSVISSTISPADIGLFVSEKYFRVDNSICHLLKTGINHTYQVDINNESYVFRVYSYDWRTKDEIVEELNLLNLLKKNSLSVSYPIEDKNGNLIQTIEAPEGKRFAVLFSFAHGKKIQNYTADIHFNIGKLMAQIHSFTRDLKQDRISYTSEVLLDQSINYIKQFLSTELEEMQFLITTKTILEAEISKTDFTSIRKGIVHLDIWFDNLNISENGDIALFDFDFCGNGWLCLDIAYYILQLHNTEKNESARIEKMASFYKGYGTIQKISVEEMRLVPTLGVCIYYFYLGIQCKRFNNWSNVFLNETYLKRYITVFIKGYYETTKSETTFL